jgi:multicomponent Na+:H+ antiporter subunit B
MKSNILRTGTTYLLPILLLFSVFLLLRGHYHPGGGFVGGLVASIAFVLHSFANSTEETLKLFRFPPSRLIPFGVVKHVCSSFFGATCDDRTLDG